MPKKLSFLIFFAIAVFITGGCTKRQCVEADYPTFQPILDSPIDGGTMSLDGPWTFDWHHNEPCEPHRYLIRVYDSDHHIVGSTQVYGPTSEVTSDSDLTFFYPTAIIYPGAEYFWNVQPRIEQELPALASELKDDGQISQTFSFMTDGLCEPGELVPPELVKPEDGSWATAISDPPKIHLEWSKLDNCYPEEYQYQVAIDPDFNNIVHTGKGGSYFLVAYIDAQNCSHLYWRVRSVVGNSASAWSETFSFYYEGDNPCWLAQSTGDDIANLNFNVQKLSTCRQTDNKNSTAVMYLEEGSVISVVATNEAKTWFLTAFDCFVSIATGEAEEGDLPLYPEQPVPVIDNQTDPADSVGNGAEQKPCSSFTGPRSCVYPRCTWVSPIAGPAYCTESD